MLTKTVVGKKSDAVSSLREQTQKIIQKIINIRRFLLMAYVEKTSYFEVMLPGYIITYKNVDNLLKNGKYTF